MMIELMLTEFQDEVAGLSAGGILLVSSKKLVHNAGEPKYMIYK